MSTKMKVGYGDNNKSISEADVDTTSVVFKVVNKADEQLRIQVFDLDDLPNLNHQRVMLYGLNKLLTDRTSDKKDKLEKLDAMQEVFALLTSDEWSKERVVGAPVTGPEVEALARLKSLSVPQVQAALAEYDKETRQRILANEEVVELAASIRAARKEQDVTSLDDMLTEE